MNVMERVISPSKASAIRSYIKMEMLVLALGHAKGDLLGRFRHVLGHGNLDPAFNLTNVLQIVVEAGLITRQADPASKRGSRA